MTTQHTPTPWKFILTHEGQTNEGASIHCAAAPWATLAHANSKDNAAFIVKAVNCHDELVEALIDMLENGDAHSKQKARVAIRKAGVTI